jgi:hypothetical protein
MEIGDLMILKIEDTTWAFKLTFGEYRKLVNELQALQENEDGDKLIDRQLQTLRERVVKVEGLTKDGEPVQWAASMVDEMNPLQVKQILGTLMNLGEAATPTSSVAT